MDPATILVMLSPLLLLVPVAGVVIVVALTQAQDEDVPRVFEACLIIFKWLADRLPADVRDATDEEDAR